MTISKMKLIVFLTAACSATVTCKLKYNQPVKRQTSSDTSIENFDSSTFNETDGEKMVDLDKSLSKCGKHQIDIRDLTIRQFQEHFKSGTLTSTELTLCYLNRIEKMDGFLKSVIEINPDAIALANRADNVRLLMTSSHTGLMHGIPILIKDNIGTFDKMETTVGAAALKCIRPKRDADVVKSLRAAGAIIIGKTNPSEWAKGIGIPDGWSSRRGLTRSAYVTNFSPWGSSSGSAVSVSANLVAVSLGTETEGSIIAPSSRNAIVGLKTTYGEISTKGLIPLAVSRDVVGPMTRTAEDAAILLGVISNMNLSLCNVDIKSCLPNKNFSVGVIRDKFWGNPEHPSYRKFARALPALEDCLKKLKSSGLASVIDPIVSPEQPPIVNFTETILVYTHEFKHYLNKYLKDDVESCESNLGRNITNLHDIIKYNEEYSLVYDQSLLRMSNKTDGLENQEYIDAKFKYFNESSSFLQSIFGKYDVDALATPCFPGEVADLYSYGAYAGYPSITVPIGVHDVGMPISICLLGKKNSEPVLLKLVYFIESVRSIPRPMPRYRYRQRP